MHRSGTTLLANAMNDAGICMGVFRDHNGEAMHFLSLNQQILWAENADWTTPKVPSAANNKTLPAALIYAEHIKAISANPTRLRLFNNAPWGWKDPRNTFTLVHWLSVFPQAKVIHVVRDGRDVALSLQARNRVAGEVFDERLNHLDFNFKLWETYVEEGLRWQKQLGKKYLQLRYEDVISGKKEVLNGLNAFCGKNVSAKIHPKPLRESNYSDDLNALAAKSSVFKKLNYHF